MIKKRRNNIQDVRQKRLNSIFLFWWVDVGRRKDGGVKKKIVNKMVANMVSLMSLKLLFLDEAINININNNRFLKPPTVFYLKKTFI